MITYLQAVGVIENFANQNEMVQKFGFEFREQMPNIATEDERYPLLFVVPIGATPTTNTNEFEIDIYCLDRYTQDRVNVGSVVSDTQLILAMLTKWLEEGQTDLDVIHSYPMQSINNDLLDYCGGWVLRVRVEVDMVSICEIPLSGIEPTPTPTCDDAIQIIEDSLGNQLYSNSIPSGATETQPIQDSTYTVEYINGTLIESGSILAEGSVVVQVPDPIVCEDVDVFIGEALVATYPSGSDVFVTVTQDGFEVIPDSVTVTDDEIDIVLADTIPCADTTIEVNGTTEGTFASGSTVDIQLSDSGGVVTPDSVTVVGNDVQIVLADCVGGSVGATLMKTGQTTSYRTGDDGDLEVGRATDFFTLASNNPFGNTNRFTDELGGSTYTNNWVIDWSTFDGATVLGYYRVMQDRVNWETAIDNSLGTFGTFAGCRLSNIKELINLLCYNVATPFNYAPFNIGSGSSLWSSTTVFLFTTQAYYFDTFIGALANAGKTNTAKYIPVRTFTVTGTTLS